MAVTARVVALALLALLALATGAWAPARAAHPLHTTFTEVAWDAPTRTLRLTVRAFAEDLDAAARASARGAETAAAMRARYVASRLVVRDAAGRPLALASCGGREERDLVFVCLAAPLPDARRGITLGHHVLTEVFDDQVNVVRLSLGARRGMALFTKGAAARQVP